MKVNKWKLAIGLLLLAAAIIVALTGCTRGNQSLPSNDNPIYVEEGINAIGDRVNVRFVEISGMTYMFSYSRYSSAGGVDVKNVTLDSLEVAFFKN